MIESLLKSLIPSTSQEKPPSVTISCDLGTPQGRRLAELAKKLLLPSTKKHASGLVTETGMFNPEAAQEFIEALRREFGDDLMQELSQNLQAQHQVKAEKRVADAAQNIMKPEIMDVVEGLLKNKKLTP